MNYEFPSSIETKFPSIMNLVSYEYTIDAPTSSVNSYKLPMPSTEFADTITASYDIDAGSATDVLTNMLSNKSNGVTGKLGKSYSGTTVSKNTMPIFQTMEHRKFQLSWTLTPKTQKDAQNMMDIINNIKRDMTAKKVEKSKGVLVEKPYLWKIFIIGKEEYVSFHPHGYVIEGVTTSFNGGQWGQFVDGKPLLATITITFVERSRLTKDILKG